MLVINPKVLKDNHKRGYSFYVEWEYHEYEETIKFHDDGLSEKKTDEIIKKIYSCNEIKNKEDRKKLISTMNFEKYGFSWPFSEYDGMPYNLFEIKIFFYDEDGNKHKVNYKEGDK